MATGSFTLTSERMWKLEGGGHCRIQEVPFQPVLDLYEVTTLPTSSKESLLSMIASHSDSIHSRAQSILREIQDSRIVAHFDFKATAIYNTPFRLLKQMNSNASVDTSFIALSYCWHNSTWSQQTDDTLNSGTLSKIPISTILFQALLAERTSLDEGIWIDQLCINQADSEEKMQAVGAMDVVYQNARLVVVVLEDIMVDEAAELALYTWIEMNERKELWDPDTNYDLLHQMTSLLWTIFSARWFTRAWCGHELRVSDRHLFLIQVRTKNQPASGTGARVLKITSGFLHDMSVMEARLESRRPSYKFTKLKALYNGHRTQFNRYMLSKLRRLPEWTDEDQKDTSKIPSYMRVFSEVFRYDASVVTDKLAIVLNILSIGLYFRGPSMTEDECCYNFYHLALAARDPTTLVTCGRRLSTTAIWMRWPRPADITEPFLRGLRHLRLPESPMFTNEEMVLDMIFLGASTNLMRPNPTYRNKAESILLQCVKLFPDEGSWPFEVGRDTSHPTQTMKLCTEILACALECGSEWTAKSCQLKDPFDFGSDFQEAMNYFCDNKFMVTNGDLADNEEYYRCIIDLLDGLGCLWLTENMENTTWLPAWVQTGEKQDGSSMFLCPSDCTFYVAIPTLLLRPEYNFLKRFWFVMPAKSDKGCGETWTVLEKTTSFGPADLMGLFQSGIVRPNQKICG